jgi:acyl-CoA reductase-like NAD-dependent aldehyde dehydrogenase
MVEMGRQFFPPGVLQALSGGEELGPWLTAHPGIGKVSFTGSCATGKKVMEAVSYRDGSCLMRSPFTKTIWLQCSKHLKRVSMELGGNDPAIICPDVDPATVASKIATVALLRSGQLCMAIKRVYVHESIYDAVLDGMAKHIERVKVGDGFDDGTVVGPISNRPQFERVKELLSNIGETKLNVFPTDNTTIEGLKGFFVRPVIVSNPPDDARVVVEEPFGTCPGINTVPHVILAYLLLCRPHRPSDEVVR